MKTATPAWQQDLGVTWRQFSRTLLHATLFLVLIGPLEKAFSDQSFAVALPELEGPVTIGVFSQEGVLIRMLCQDASLESLPAGLNGLIMSWDEKDAGANRVPAGSYLVKGIVHGPLSFSEVGPSEVYKALVETPATPIMQPIQENKISVRAAADALLESPPLLTLDASLKDDKCIMMAEGLPILSIPLSPPVTDATRNIRLTSEKTDQSVILSIEGKQSTNTWRVTGLDRLVPLSIGKLEVKPDAFLSTRGAGESTP
jgi:hypothetical protein